MSPTLSSCSTALCARCSAASITDSSRGRPSTSAVSIRPASITISTCWRRSSSYCRAIILPRRAVAFQSMVRVSSPGTHSFRLSNIRPSPIRRTLRKPASRRRCAWVGRERSEAPTRLGYTTAVQGSDRRAWRQQSPHGPSKRRSISPPVPCPAGWLGAEPPRSGVRSAAAPAAARVQRSGSGARGRSPAREG